MDHGDNPGPTPYLNREGVRELGVFLKKIASMGYGKLRKQVMATAEAYVKCEKRALKVAQITQASGLVETVLKMAQRSFTETW